MEVCFAFYPHFPLNNKDFVIIFQIKKEIYDFCRIYIIECKRSKSHMQQNNILDIIYNEYINSAEQ